MRAHLNDEEREAMHLLDLVRGGCDVPASAVWWALLTTGDAAGARL